jgi:hypothetical protein
MHIEECLRAVAPRFAEAFNGKISCAADGDQTQRAQEFNAMVETAQHLYEQYTVHPEGRTIGDFLGAGPHERPRSMRVQGIADQPGLRQDVVHTYSACWRSVCGTESSNHAKEHRVWQSHPRTRHHEAPGRNG